MYHCLEPLRSSDHICIFYLLGYVFPVILDEIFSIALYIGRFQNIKYVAYNWWGDLIVKKGTSPTVFPDSIGCVNQFGSIHEFVLAIMSAIQRDFMYSPGATNVSTTVNETLELRKGVCQDFTHLMLAICRVKGIPARYISGYHFVQDLQCVTCGFEQASHAWVAAHIPGVGWFGFDPTNNNVMSWRYIKLGHGRDYLDIVPTKGIYRGAGNPKMEVTVDVRKVEEELDS